MTSAADAKLERLANVLFLLLNATRPRTLDEIVAEVPGYPAEGRDEARRQAFERDKAELRAEGVPVETVALPDGRTGYRVDPGEYYLPDLGLTPDEQLALRFARSAVRLAGAGADPLPLLGDDAELDTIPVLAALPELPQLPVLYEANRRRAPATFGYRGSARAVDVYAVLFREGFWYAIGREHAADAVKTFRVDRVEGDVTLGPSGAFARPDGFDARAHLPDDPLLIGGDDPVDAEIAVDAAHARRVVDQIGEDRVVTRGADGGVVVRVPVANRDAFRSWLLGFLDHAEVVAPEALRAEVVDWLERIAR